MKILLPHIYSFSYMFTYSGLKLGSFPSFLLFVFLLLLLSLYFIFVLHKKILLLQSKRYKYKSTPQVSTATYMLMQLLDFERLFNMHLL